MEDELLRRVLHELTVDNRRQQWGMLDNIKYFRAEVARSEHTKEQVEAAGQRWVDSQYEFQKTELARLTEQYRYIWREDPLLEVEHRCSTRPPCVTTNSSSWSVTFRKNVCKAVFMALRSRRCDATHPT